MTEKTEKTARPEKVAQVESLRDRLARAKAVVLTDYRGLTVAEMDLLRGKLREARVEYAVVKNRLLGRAAREAGIDGLDPYLEGPTAVAFAYENPTLAAKVIHEFIRQMRKLEAKGGVVDGRVVTGPQVKALADLPSREVLVSRVLGGIQAPLVGLMGVLTGLQRNLVYALDQVRQQREAAADSAAG